MDDPDSLIRTLNTLYDDLDPKSKYEFLKPIYEKLDPNRQSEFLKGIDAHKTTPEKIIYSYIKGDRKYGTTIDFYELSDTPEDNSKVLNILFKRLSEDDHLGSDDNPIVQKIESDLVDAGLDHYGADFDKAVIEALSKDITIFNSDIERLIRGEIYFCMFKTSAADWKVHFKYLKVGGESINPHFIKI